MNLLILAHIPNAYKIDHFDFLGLGDGIRLVILSNLFEENGIKADICINHNMYQLLSHPLILRESKFRNILVWEKLNSDMFSNYDKIIYLDQPKVFNRLKKIFGLSDQTEVLASNHLSFKESTFDLSSHLAKSLGVQFCMPKLFNRVLDKTKKKVGLNYLVPNIWANKSPSLILWNHLYERLSLKGYHVSWQTGENDLNEYITWIHSQDIVIIPNSLALHLAILLNIGFVLMLGPTSCEEVKWLPKEVLWMPDHCELFPCYKQSCPIGKSCFDNLDTDEIVKAVEKWFS